MKVGIAAVTDPSAGGIYQSSGSVISALRDQPTEDELVLLSDGRSPAVLPACASALPMLPLFGPPGTPPRPPFEPRMDAPHRRPEVNAWLRSQGLGLALYPTARRIAFESGIPFVLAIHDLQHRLQPEFPEVSANGEWEQREYLFKHGAIGAAAILADSEVGKQDILDCYGDVGVTADKVFVLPFVPPNYLDFDLAASIVAPLRRGYGLTRDYLFYPAQFWPHKNHLRLVEALAMVRHDLRIDVTLALAGSHRGALREQTHAAVIARAQELGVRDAVHILGYVPDQDMAALYLGSRGLVMPTFFGPTNIPVLEAWQAGVPVLTSDIHGIREQIGDAGVLVDPRDPHHMARGMARLLTDNGLRDELVAAGRARLATYTVDDFSRRLSDAVRFAQKRVKEGGVSHAA